MILHDYESSSGRNLITDYIDGLTEDETIDGYSVREYMENGEFEKYFTKDGKRKYMKCIFINTIVYFI